MSMQRGLEESGLQANGLPVALLQLAGVQLEYQLLPAHQTNRPTLVFLHEGLGSLALWRDFPVKLAAATGCETLIYSRRGYGWSDVREGPLDKRYLHDEALIALPAILERLRIVRPVLIGHSDGASIALIHAGDGRWECAGLVVVAPHVLVEECAAPGLRAVRHQFEVGDLAARLARYHRDPHRTFHNWNDIWLDPGFADWNITDRLPEIRCPVLAIQGEEDEYASMLHLDTIGDMCPTVELLKLADCRHTPFRDQPRVTLEAIERFVARL